MAFFDRAPRRRRQRPAMFLLDEVLDIRTFENFPGCGTCSAIDRAPGGEPGALRPGVAVHGARAPPASRRAGALRSRALPPLSTGVEVVSLALLSTAGAATGPRRRRAGRRARRPAARPTRICCSKRSRRMGPCDRSGGGAGRAVRARRPPDRPLPRELRVPPASRARLRRAQGDPRHPRRRRAAEPHRDRAAPAPHAGLDQGLPVVARRRRPDHDRRASATRSTIRCCACTSASTRRPVPPTDDDVVREVRAYAQARLPRAAEARAQPAMAAIGRPSDGERIGHDRRLIDRSGHH